MKLPIMMYVREVLFKVTTVMAISFVIPSILLFVIDEDLLRLVAVVLLSMTVTTVTTYLIGLNDGEKKYIIGWSPCISAIVPTSYRKVFPLDLFVRVKST